MWTQKQIKKGVCFVYKYDGVQFSKSDDEGGVEWSQKFDHVVYGWPINEVVFSRHLLSKI